VKLSHRDARIWLAAALTLTPCEASVAQSAAVRATLDSREFKAAASEQFWQSIASLACPDSDVRAATTGGTFDRSSLHAAFRDRVGVIARQPGGMLLSRSEIGGDEGIRVEDVRVTARMSGEVLAFGYLLTPRGAMRGPAAIMIPATGVAATETLGWKIPGDEGIAIRSNPHPMRGAALELARRGVTVFVPWMGRDHQFFPYLPWLQLERIGVSQRLWTGRGNTYSVLLPLLSGVVDFLVREPSVDARRIAAVGWEEGALLAGWLAVYDARVAVVGSMSAPLDRAAMRRDRETARYGAAFTQMDCALGDAHVAALVAPRPMGYVYSTRDDVWPKVGRFATIAAEQSVRRAFASAGGTQLFINRVNAGTLAVRDTMVAWLVRVLRATDSHTVSSGALEVSQTLRVDPLVFAARDAQLAVRVSGAGRCQSLDAVGSPSTVHFAADQQELRRRLAARLQVPGVPRTAPMRVVRRDTLPGTEDMRLEWIAATGLTGRDSLQVLGVLATPRRRQGPFPTVLGLDGYTGLSQVFGMPPVGRTSYLNAYGVELVNAGFAVFVPYVPAEFPEYAAAIAVARAIPNSGSWAAMMPYYFSARRLLQSLPETRDQALTVYGISYAGVAAILLSALDPSIDALVYSNPVQGLQRLFKSQDAPLLAMWWTEMCDIQTVVQKYLIVPRPFIWENGALDANAYLDGVDPVGDIARVYSARGATGRFRFLRHGGEHETRLGEWGPLVLEMLPREAHR
jgi:dienelactone hydrolase